MPPHSAERLGLSVRILFSVEATPRLQSLTFKFVIVFIIPIANVRQNLRALQCFDIKLNSEAVALAALRRARPNALVTPAPIIPQTLLLPKSSKSE